MSFYIVNLDRGAYLVGERGEPLSYPSQTSALMGAIRAQEWGESHSVRTWADIPQWFVSSPAPWLPSPRPLSSARLTYPGRP